MKTGKLDSKKGDLSMRLLTICCIILVCFSITHAELKDGVEKTGETHFSAGFQLHDFNDDFGCGINLTSPWLWNKKAAIRLSQDIVFSNIKNWKPYGSSRLGVVGSTGLIHRFLRLYGEGGLQVLVVNKKISSDMISIGGYGHFGFEFITNSNSCFIELGTSGVGVRADKLEGKPLYFNGFCIGVGTRHYF